MDLENGMRAGVIDVPGHEKFIRNMAAGAPGDVYKRQQEDET